MVITYVVIAFVLGLAIGHVAAIVYATKTIVMHSQAVVHLVQRGDAAIAMLQRVKDIQTVVKGQPDRNKARVKLAESFNEIDRLVNIGTNMRVEPTQKA